MLDEQLSKWTRFKSILNSMEKYSDYIIVHATDADELSRQKQHLKDGWIVLGAPFSHSGQAGQEIWQALIKQDALRPGSIGFNR